MLTALRNVITLLYWTHILTALRIAITFINRTQEWPFSQKTKILSWFLSNIDKSVYLPGAPIYMCNEQQVYDKMVMVVMVFISVVVLMVLMVLMVMTALMLIVVMVVTVLMVMTALVLIVVMVVMVSTGGWSWCLASVVLESQAHCQPT